MTAAAPIAYDDMYDRKLNPVISTVSSPSNVPASMSSPASTHRKPRRPRPIIETEYTSVNWKRFFFAPKYLVWHLLGIATVIATIYVTIHHDEIVEALRPFSEKIRDLPGGWLIPLIILIIISFPPLFGHEIVAVLCGVVYNIWIGFAIVAAGTFLGEIGTWYAFKYLLSRKAAKLERTNLNYGAMARMTRDGGFWVVLIIRISIVPSHFSTAVFSCCDVKFWYFAVATFLALPKQLILVYIGVLITQKESGKTEQHVAFVIALLATLILGVYIWWKMRDIKKILLQEQEERRLARETASGPVMELDSTPPSGPFSTIKMEDLEPVDLELGSNWSTVSQEDAQLIREKTIREKTLASSRSSRIGR